MVSTMVLMKWGSPRHHGGNAGAGTEARGRTTTDGYLCVPRFHGAGSKGPIGGGSGSSDPAADTGHTKLVGNGGPGNTNERQES